MGKKKGKGSINELMAMYMKGSERIIKLAGKDCINGRMGGDIKGNGKIIKCMDKGSNFWQELLWVS